MLPRIVTISMPPDKTIEWVRSEAIKRYSHCFWDGHYIGDVIVDAIVNPDNVKPGWEGNKDITVFLFCKPLEPQPKS